MKPYRVITTLACSLALATLGMASVVACETTPNGGGTTGIPAVRGGDLRLEKLYDATSSADSELAWAAAKDIADLPATDLAKISVYWGVRGRNPEAARLIGDALEAKAEAVAVGSSGGTVPTEAARLANESLEWMRRALGEINPHKDYVTAAYYRLVMARAFLVLGRGAEAFELLANRLDTRPLPVEIEQAYEQLLAGMTK